MKRPCDIVQDLLPLYLDGILKQETIQFVKEHLKSCEQCMSLKKELWKGHIWKSDQNIAEAIPVPQKDEMELIGRIRSWKRKTSIAGILLIFLISLISWFIGKTYQEDTPQPVIKPAIVNQTGMIYEPKKI